MLPWLQGMAWALIIGGPILMLTIGWSWIIVWYRYLVLHGNLQRWMIWLTLFAALGASLFAYLAVMLPESAISVACASLVLACILFATTTAVLVWNRVLIHRAEMKLQEDIRRMQGNAVSRV